MILETYVNNVLEGGFQIWGAAEDGTPIFHVIEGGSVDLPVTGDNRWGYAFLHNPNAWPGVAPESVKGSAISEMPILPVYDDQTGALTGHEFSQATAWAFVGGGGQAVRRMFFQKLELAVAWSIDGTDDTVEPLVGRWVGGAQTEYNWYYASGRIRPMSWSPGPDYYWPPNLDWSGGRWTFTDELGIATYYGLVGIAEAGGSGFTLQVPEQNLGLATNCFQAHYEVSQAAPRALAYPWALPEPYYYRQKSVDADVGGVFGDGGRGWSIDYATAWNPSTGMLQIPDESFALHAYKQGVEYRGLPTGTVVSWGDGRFGGTKPAGVEPWRVYSIPRGSLLDGVRMRPEDQFQQDPTQIPPITEMPLLDASDYPPHSSDLGPDGANLEPHLVMSRGYLQIVPETPVFDHAFGAPVKYTGVAGNVLEGVEYPFASTIFMGVGRGAFDGGEVVTLDYLDYVVTPPGGSPSAPKRLQIREDEFSDVQGDGGGVPGKPSPEGLDLHVSPFGEPSILGGSEAGVDQWIGTGMEKAFTTRTALKEVLASLSGVVLEDHRRLLLGITASGAAQLWLSSDDWQTDRKGTGTAIDPGTWPKGILREGPHGSLYVWLVGNGGRVSVMASGDGGTTWELPRTVETLPAGRVERGDARWDGARWLRLHPRGTGVTLFVSFDGEAWADAGEVCGFGLTPWLCVVPDGTLIAVTSDGATIEARRGSDAAGTWAWSAPVTVAVSQTTPEDGEGVGAVAWATAQKVMVAWREKARGVTFAVSRDGGTTWQLGGEG